MDMTDKMGLTVQEAVTLSGIGRTRIFDAIKSRQLKAKKFGRRTLILPDSLKNFLETLPDREVAR
jgi:excisionase family DNA binding protein